jgi:hypothetical protein
MLYQSLCGLLLHVSKTMLLGRFMLYGIQVECSKIPSLLLFSITVIASIAV